MGNMYGRIILVLLLLSIFTAFGYARRSPTCRMPAARVSTAHGGDLVPFLQAEVNEVALLQAQQNCLQQQGDPLGAALVASYIPDHQMQVNALSAAITARGGDPSMVKPNGELYLGTRDQVIGYDLDAHMKATNDYHNLANRTNDAAIKQLALSGESAASRHFSSLQVAQAASSGSASQMQQGLLASLTLERGVINDLQTQATQLRALGDTTDADLLLAMVPQHQATADQQVALLTQIGGNPDHAVPVAAVPIATKDDILLHERVVDTQLVNTYALTIASAPVDSPLRNAAAMGQQVALGSLTRLQPITTAALYPPTTPSSAVNLTTTTTVTTTPSMTTTTSTVTTPAPTTPGY